MKKLWVYCTVLLASVTSYSQNDIDAIRYSRIGVNGTSRYVGMGGAFGALGADLSCASFNPAGLGLYRKGEASFGGGLKFTNNNGTLDGKSIRLNDAKFVFNNFGITFTMPATNDNENRHVFAFTNTQLQNFFSKSRIQTRTSNTLAKDMLTLANEKKMSSFPNSFPTASVAIAPLDPDYEYMGYYTYVLDYDSASGKFYSFVDPKRSVLQTRDIVTAGKMNELNFSYAFAYKDQFYIGASLGIPRVSYTSTTTHTETDDKDSMRVTMTTANTFTSTYVDGLPYVYSDKLGFHSLTYQEYFTTTGNGFNLKIGGVARVNDMLRLGLYYHTPTIYNLTDTYYNSMNATFDYDKKAPAEEIKSPEDGGYYKYKVYTPARLGFNLGLILDRKVAIGIDYEYVDYRTAQLSGENISDFAGVNVVIKNKYLSSSNIRTGVEFNLKPVMLRAGYNMQGSPFGNASGNFVRHTASVGFGFRSKNNIFYDFAWFKTFTNEDYYMFNTNSSRATFNLSSSQLAATVGIKF